MQTIRKFQDGYDWVEVWSESMEAHIAALSIYRKRGWELMTNKPNYVKGSAVPFRSLVRRRLKRSGDDD